MSTITQIPSTTGARIEYEACPLCAGESFKSVGEVDCSAHPLWSGALPKTIKWMSCADCGHRFTSGYFGEDARAALFRKVNPHQQPGHDVQAQRLVRSRIVQRAGTLQGGIEGRWLDIGFGNGALMAAADEFGYEASGIDLRGSVVDDMRGYGYAAFEADLTQISDNGMFNVISFADVLEHMPFPAEGLANARRLLADDGLVFVSMPNMDTFVWRVLERQGKNPYWAELEHYHNFNRERLHAVLRGCGFEPCQYAVSERYLSGMEVFARKVEIESESSR